MITFNYKTFNPSVTTIQRYLTILGTIAACAIVLVSLLFLLWLAQEVVQAIAELCHMIATANPLIITGVLVVLAIWLLGKVKR